MPFVAILEEADREDPSAAREGRGRFGPLVLEFSRRGIDADTVFYRDEDRDRVEETLARHASAVLVFVNPVHNGRDRSLLDPMLDRLSAHMLVSARPSVIQRMGTKAVLYDTQNLSWSSGDVHRASSAADMRAGLLDRLQAGSRVLKRMAGNGGGQVWRLTLVPGASPSDPMVHLLRAAGGGDGEILPLDAALATVWGDGGDVVDQPYHRPGPDGMVRCYLTQGVPVGFGHQTVSQLTAGPGEQPLPGTPRRYFPVDDPRFLGLRRLMEQQWVPELGSTVGVGAEELPVIWDADFFWWRDGEGNERFELCEINASCVHPYPDSAIVPMVDATIRHLHRAGL